MRLLTILVCCVSFANAQQPVKPTGSAPAKKAANNPPPTTREAFVPLPEDIHCSFGPGTAVAGTATTGWMFTEVGALACRITKADGGNPNTATPPSKDKDIVLTGPQSSMENPFTKQAVKLTKLVDGVLATKDFGDLKVIGDVKVPASGDYVFTLGIRPARLRAFREFLLQGEIIPGIYIGSANGLPLFSVTLVSSEQGIMVSEFGYKFTGYAAVGRAFLKNKQPFGDFAGGKLTFEVMVLKSIGIPNATALHADMGTGLYRAELTADDTGQLKCVLSQIKQLDGVYANVGFTLETITFDMGSEKPPLKKEYTMTLKNK